MAAVLDQDSDADSWVHIDPDNPADSDLDDAGVVPLSSSSSGCTTPEYCRSDDEDDQFASVLALSSPASPSRPFPDDEGLYDDDDAEGIYDDYGDLEELPEKPTPPDGPEPLSGLFHHTLDGDVDYAAFDPILCWPKKVLVPDPSFSACNEEVTVLASNRGLVCLRARATGGYIVANPATSRRIRLPRHSCEHLADGDPAVVITFEEKTSTALFYHVVVAFPLGEGVFAFESFSSRTWEWTVGAGVSAVEQVVSASGVGALGRAFWRTTIGHILCYDPAAGTATLIPAPLEVLQWPCFELGEMNGTLAVICMDDRVEEVAVINLHLQHGAKQIIKWSLVAHFEGGGMRNRDTVQLLRSQGHEVVMWDPTLELVVAMDTEGRTTRTIGPLTGRQYYSDFIPYVRSSTRVIEAGDECTFAAADV